MKKLSSFAGIILIAILGFTSCKKDELIKPVIPPTSVPVATCVADTSVYVTIYLMDSPLLGSFTNNCFAVVKCSNDSILGDSVHLEAGVIGTIPVDFCTASLGVIPANVGFGNFQIDSTNPNFIEFYEGITLLVRFPLDASGVTGPATFIHPSINGATYCSPDSNGENVIYIYR